MVTQGLQTSSWNKIASGADGSAAGVENDSKKKQIAQDFEAMFIHQMLKSMRNTLSGDSIAGAQSSGRRIFTEMLDEEVSKQASAQGGLGLADIIYRHMGGDEVRTPERQIPLSVLQHTAYASRGASVPKAQGSQIEAWIAEASRETGVDADLVRSVIHQESGGNAAAYSPAGAKGLMQLMDGTARDMGVTEVWDPRQNVMGGTRYLKRMLDRFDGDESLALAAYNAGPEAVRRHGGIPPYSETRNYVKSVLGYKRMLQQDKEVGYDG